MGTTSAGVEYWDGSDPGDIAAATLALATSINPTVVGNYANAAAAESARVAMPAGARPLAHVQGQGVQYWNGTEWVWVTDPPIPIVYQSAFGISSDFNTPSPAWLEYVGYGFTFTPTRTGYADVFCDWDAAQTGAFTGWGSAKFRVLMGGALVDTSPPIIFEQSPSRDSGRMMMRSRLRLGNGVPAVMSMQIQNAFNGGLWHFNSFSWFIVQQ